MKNRADFSGITTPLVSPFDKRGEVDWESFRRLLRFQTENGVRRFVVAGTTGEGPVLTDSEISKMCRVVKEWGKTQNLNLKLMIATGSFSTAQSLNKTKKAEQEWGADGFLLVCPYYNRPPQKGLVSHFESIASKTHLPIVLYNVPSRTACSLSVASIKTLSERDNILGIKEASGELDFLKEIQKAVAPDFLLLSGDDMSFAKFLNLGGHGAISASANILPKLFIGLLGLSPAGRLDAFEKYRVFLKELYRETNPIGLKQALTETGRIKSSFLRLPLVAVHNPALSQALKTFD